MAFRRPAPAPPVAEIARNVLPPRIDTLPSLVAAAAQVQLDQGSVMRRQVTDQEWQREAWRHYDLCGEFRFAANRHAAALSRCRLYVAKLDELGRPAEEADDPKVQILAETIFGGPAAKAEGLRTIGVQLYVSGEGYIVAEAATNPNTDAWYVVTPAAIKKENAGYKVRRPEQLGNPRFRVLKKGTDLLMRVWTPHPRENDVADSPARAVLSILREIERLSLLTFSQIDSRLISAGIITVPQGMDFPHAEDKPGGITGLMDMILEAARAQLSGAGTAAGLVPILIEIPTGTGSDIQHHTFDTPLTAEIKDKLDHAIRRLALGLDMAPEDLLGQGSSNHWSAWAIDETSIKLFIEPAMIRVCDALTVGYLNPALKAIGEDPEEYTLWYDAGPLKVRPNRFEDAVRLYELGELDGAELRVSGGFDAGIPTKEELAAWRAWEAIKLNPKLLEQEEYAELVGLPVVAAKEEPPPGNAITLPPDFPGQDRTVLDEEQRGLPQQPGGEPAPSQDGEQGFAALLAGAEQAVFRALEVAGGRLLDRHARGRYPGVERFQLHTHVAARDPEHVETLLAGAWTHVPSLAAHCRVPAGDLQRLLGGYCSELLTRGYPHTPDLLAEVLRRGWPDGR